MAATMKIGRLGFWEEPMAEDHNLREIFADTETAEPQEQTFLGGTGFFQQ